MGSLDVLNCGAGHLSFNFDKGDPTEVERARKVVEDMLKRGYTIFVEVDGELRKVESFDPATSSYIISDAPEPRRGKRGPKRRVPMSSTKATGVGPTAGG